MPTNFFPLHFNTCFAKKTKTYELENCCKNFCSYCTSRVRSRSGEAALLHSAEAKGRRLKMLCFRPNNGAKAEC